MSVARAAIWFGVGDSPMESWTKRVKSRLRLGLARLRTELHVGEFE